MNEPKNKYGCTEAEEQAFKKMLMKEWQMLEDHMHGTSSTHIVSEQTLLLNTVTSEDGDR